MENYDNPYELNSFSTIWLIQTMNLSKETHSLSISHLSFVLSDPLFSSIVALYTLILLYLPHLFLKFLFSPVILLTGIILFTLIRLASTQECKGNNACKEKEYVLTEEIVPNEDHQVHAHACKGQKESETTATEDFIYYKDHSFACKSDTDSESEKGFDQSLSFEENFVEWDVKAPLEVIYEECEGDEADGDRNSVTARNESIERYPSLSLYYPESDSDSSCSDGDFPAVVGKWELPESLYFRWDEEDREGLIEIALDHKKQLDLQFEEDNLIEIDISPKSNEEW